MEVAIHDPNRVSSPEGNSPDRIEETQNQEGMVTRFNEADLIANVDEVGGETKLSHGAEGDEQEKVWVISCLEGGHLGEEEGTVSGRMPQV